MKGEIPVFRRCCCCLPLRYGLLVWGYFKMTADIFLVSLMSYILIHTITMMRLHAKGDYISRIYTELAISIIAIAVFFTDFIVTIVFIVGGHKKNVQLIRAFYFMSMGMWVATFLLAAITIISSIQDYLTFGMRFWYLSSILMASCFYFVVLVVQTYFLLLLRSEIIKLRDNGEFRFVNNATEAECTMKCEEIVMGAETIMQDA